VLSVAFAQAAEAPEAVPEEDLPDPEVEGLPSSFKAGCGRWLAEARVTLAGSRPRAEALRRAALRAFRRTQTPEACDAYRVADATADVQACAASGLLMRRVCERLWAMLESM